MSIQRVHITLLVLSASFVSTVLTCSRTPSPVSPTTTASPQTMCDLVRRPSQVCYQCGRLHEEDYHLVYNGCCSGTEADRPFWEYCEEIYSEPPRRGGTWQ